MHVRHAFIGLLVLASAEPMRAQTWDSPRVLEMVRRATDRRVQQLSDSGLLGYQAAAHGYVTFLAQLGEGFRLPPKVVKADELALQVYWRAPNLSKQQIIGRRDTTLLPTDIAYHMDHLGIVQNNFPATIRLGDGDEVRDVRHPLSGPGMATYEYALSDSLRISIPGRTIDVYEVRVRPKDDRQPGVIGAVYLDRADGRVVRMAFNFTQASFVDKQLEDVSIVLENGLVGAQYWLPRRQEVEIRRKVEWLDYPARGIIRGRWDIGDYQLNVGDGAVRFVGPEVVSAPPAVLKAYQWLTPRLVDSLPAESRLATPEEIKRVQASARQIVQQHALDRAGVKLAARTASDFVRFDRNSGLALGAGSSIRMGNGLSLDAIARFGAADKMARSSVAAVWRSAGGTEVRAEYRNTTQSAGDVAERSAIVNSLAAQEFGSDFTDQFRVVAGEVTVSMPAGGWRVALAGGRSGVRPLPAVASSFSGTLEPAFDASPANMASATLRAQHPDVDVLGFRWEARAELRLDYYRPALAASCSSGSYRCSHFTVNRGAIWLDGHRPLGDMTAGVRLLGVGTEHHANMLLAQQLALIGGPVSAPGFGYHSLIGDQGVAMTTELRVPIPFIPVSLGRFGRSPARAQFTPHYTVAGIRANPSTTTIVRYVTPFIGSDPLRPRPSGWYQSAGVSLITFFDLIVFDVSRETSRGPWRFSVDIARPFWGIL